MLFGLRSRVCVLAVLSAVVAPDSAMGQQRAGCHPGEGTAGLGAPEKLPPPVKMTGIGNSSMTITAANDDGKAWFTQGLNLLHDFWDYESARAFEQAVRTDPKCAMCYWGLYQAYSFRRGDGTPFAHDALMQAVKLKKGASHAERLYIEAAVKEEKQKTHATQGPNTSKDSSNRPHVDTQSTKVLRKLVKMYPDDVQARIFLAQSLMDGFDKKGEPRAGTVEGQRILVTVLEEHPADSAANHYWIHAVEPGNHPELALDSARKLGPLTPASGHMVHMPGHIFYRTGDYETARVSFEDSMHVDESYMQVEKVSVENDWNYVHNLMYLIADLMEAGRIAEATEISGKLTTARGVSGPTLYRQAPRDGLSRLDVRLPVLLRGGDWHAATEALEASQPDPELKNLSALRASMLDYTKGMIALEQGDRKAAEKLAADLDGRLQSTSREKMEDVPAAAMVMSPTAKDAMAKPLHSFLDVAASELQASVLLAEGRGEESDAMFGKAADAEHELGYREPPMYIRPVGETRGDALMRAGRYDEAKKAYEDALAERPNSGYPLFGIAQADERAKRVADATADYARLMRSWKHADPDLPQLKTAQAWMESHAASRASFATGK